MAQRTKVNQGLLTVETSRSNSDTPHSLGFLWTTDQPDAETTTWQDSHKRQTSMIPAEFEPAIPASGRPQTSHLRPRGHLE